MNHIYRHVWNELTRAWVAVAENARGRGKRGSATVGTLAAVIALIGAPAHALDAGALPSGGKVVAGSASISQAANVLTVQQTTQRTALDWQSFNIGSAATVNFVQPGSSAVALNRIVGNEASQIYGKLNSNGQVFFSNPNGMLFARGAEVNVGGILATTLSIGNEDFMAGNYRFTNPGSGSIRNEGIINALGSVALIGNDVHNAGQIIATTVTLAAGNTVAVDLTGDGLIRARVEDAALTASIENSGSIEAAQVMLTTGQARDTLDRVVNNSGVVRATGLANVNGEIVLEGGWLANTGTLAAGNADGSGGSIAMAGATVMLGGTVAADGTTQGGSIVIDADGASFAGLLSATGGSGQGGRIDIRSQTLALHNVWSALDVSGATGGNIREVAGHQITSSASYLALGGTGLGGYIDLSAPATKLLSAQVDASGATGGGRVRLGGEYQGGKNLTTDELPNAETLAVSAGSVIRVDATRSGDGGTAILWSDLESALYPAISATGKDGGAGGFVELSSAEKLLWGGSVNAGPGGRVLMDPKNIVIQDASLEAQYNLVLGYNYNNLPRLGIGLQTADSFGYSVALSGTQLAVGAIGDDGFANVASASGAVYLFNNPYTTPTLAGIIGRGYTGAGNYNLATLEASDSFGISVALSGTRLAVGASGDDGFANVASGSGAVYLFNNPFSATPTLAGTLGKGYTGTGDYDASALTTSSAFGMAVALSGTQLAVGASGHFDFDITENTGAVYLFKDIDTTPTLSGIIGKGYTGSGDFDLNVLENGDTFGRSISLSGTQLAVGASGDDGADNLTSGAGAVYLFNNPFTTPTLTGTLGKGYTGAGSYNFSTLKASDAFGTSVALSGTRLAAGAFGDDGYGATTTTLNYGAVHLFGNLDTTPTLAGTLGKGYTGTGSLDMAGLKTSDAFGRGVALDGTQLAVGASGDDGYGSTTTGLNYGAVYLFNNIDSTPTRAGTLGSGYTGASDFDLRLLKSSDSFGSAVSLSATQLAVGAYGDQLYAGAVYLFSDPYTTPTLSGVIGKGYAGAGNFNVGTLEMDDFFGNAVSLSGTQLAVGAYNDSGADNVAPGSGAVYLFNNPFSVSPTLAGIIGKGYTGTGSFNLGALDDYDQFGSAVSLSGTQLAVGAFYDAGVDNLAPGSGAVYLFNNPFTTPTLAGTIGKGYTGTGSFDLTRLDTNDYFGTAVSLSGTQLAVGAPNDGGFDRLSLASGAVYLFNNPFSASPTLTGTLGKGYSGNGSYNLAALEAWDNFGTAVSLSGTQLAVGAPNDGGFDNTSAGGAVYLFNNLDTTPTLAGTIGKGYTGTGNFDLGALEGGDYFGGAVSLSGTQLAVGAPYDYGLNNTGSDVGAVYLFTLAETSSDPASGQTFATNPAADATITPTSIVEILNTGAALTLQANNDITVASNIFANNPAGDGGALTMQAGRSILVNATIDTDNGALTLVANHAGADPLNRDAGPALLDASTATLRASTMQFTNTDAGGGATLLNNLTASGAVVSDAATFTQMSGSNILYSSLDVQSGGVSGAGTLNIDGGSTALTGALTATSVNIGAAGTLMGSGTVTVGGGSGTLTNAGAIRPGDGAATGTLTIDGNLAMTGTGWLYARLNGTASGSHDKLAVTGTASFAAGSTIDLFGFGGAGSYAIVTAGGGVSGTPTISNAYFTQTTATNANDITVTATANLIENAVTWDGGANTENWEDAANWSTDTLPGSGSNIFIDAGWNVANSSGTSLAHNLASRSPLSLSGGSLTLAGDALFSNSLGISGGTLTGSGAITVASGGGLYWYGGVIDATAPAPLTTLAGSTSYFSGGTLGANRSWTSSGELNLGGNLSTASLPAFTRTAGSSVTLSGIFDIGGGTLDIGGAGIFGSGGLTSLGGTLRNGTVLSSDATPTLAGNAGVLDGVTLGGTALAASGTLTINNGITLADGVAVNIGNGTWRFGGSGTQHVATPGTATLDSAGGTLAAGYNITGQTLQIDSGVTLRGYGTLTKINTATIVNAGTINANTAGQTFTVSPSTFTQYGTVNVASGATFAAPAFTNNGTLTGGGTFTIGGGTGTLTNAKTIAPGDTAGAAGILTITGNLATSGSNALLAMDLNGASDYDRLAVSGNVSFATGNKIALSGIGGAAAYPIVTASGTISGTPNVTSLTFTQTTAATANAVTVTATANTAENAVFWDGGAGTWNWADVANWSTDALPTSADNVLINAFGTVGIAAGAQFAKNLVSLSDFALSGGSLDLSGTALFGKAAGIGGGALTSGGAISVASGGTLNWTGGTLGATTAAALATQAGSTTNFTAGILGSNLAWTSSGTLNLAGNTSLSALPAFSRAAGSTVNVTGVLDLGSSSLDIGDAGIFGSGGLNTFSGTLKNGTVRNSNATPTLASTNGTLDNVTLGGSALTTSGTLYIDNGITLADGITVNKGSTTWNFRGSGTQHIATTGTSTLNNSGGELRAGVSATGQTLQIDSGVTLQGYGWLMENSATASIVNAGTINANTAGQTFNIRTGSLGNFSNSGTLNVSGGTLNVTSVDTTTPAWTNTGTINLGSGTLSLGGKFAIADLANGHLTRSGGSLSLTGVLDNSNNTLDVGNAGLFGSGGLNTFSGTIKGGTVLSTNATPTLASSAGKLDGVTLGGTRLNVTGTLHVNNGITLANGITVDKGSGDWYFGTAGVQHIATTGSAVINSAGGVYFPNYNYLADQSLQIDSGVTLQGYGYLAYGSYGGIITNYGTIVANTAGQTFSIGPAAFTNSGTLNLSGGNMSIAPIGATGPNWSNTGTINLGSGTLSLGGKFTTASLGGFTRSGGTIYLSGILDNSNNTLDVGSAGVFGSGGLNLLTGTIKNGTVLSTDAMPTLTSSSGSGGTLDGVMFGGTALTASGNLYIDNGITLANGVTVDKGSGTWNFRGSGTQHIATTGTALLNSAGGYLVAGYGTAGQTLQIDSGMTLQGYGTLSGTSATVVNSGTIRANTGGQSFSIRPATFNNTGTLSVTAGSLYVTAASFTNNGTVAASAGALNIYDTTFTNSGALDITGGSVFISNIYYPADIWTNPGTINLTSGALNLGGTFTAAALGSGHYYR